MKNFHLVKTPEGREIICEGRITTIKAENWKEAKNIFFPIDEEITVIEGDPYEGYDDLDFG